MRHRKKRTFRAKYRKRRKHNRKSSASSAHWRWLEWRMEPKDNDDPLTRADLAAAVAAVTVEARAAHDREARLSSAHEAEIRALENRHAERIGELQKMLREEEQRSTSRMVESLEHVHHVGQERALLRAALEHVLIVIDQPTNQESGSLAGEQLVDVARQIAHKALGTAPTEKM